ncbi:hypothetical protein EUTSA_v10026263mg [Eutrema salsugineum]|uniref:Uncharacterized protein n=1 Tax=Eutrema salsugineum TaxID=72664 RepID=V4M0B3_EUTSA|nr:uncharacterized protein At4g13200, chloroplastic isoform X2 [Eutrema salsugineum]ESQ56405.1 hypothetical protein EUTSA_v10026263mg [Eutrema salsugineum]
MSSFAISSSSSFSLSNAYHHPSRLRFISHKPRSNLEFCGLRLSGEAQRTSLRCNCCSKGNRGENENRSVLDAFFLGKALAEVINERIESTVGEVLGTIGRFQAEQQKQVQEIQEEVFERAKKAKERAARETMEEQGLVAPKPETLNRKPAAGVVTFVTPTSTVESKDKSNENLSGFSGSSMGRVVESSSSSDEDSVVNDGT